MRKLTLFLCAVFLTMIGYSQGSETFANITDATGDGNEISSSYQGWTWTGDNGEEWNATDARTDQTINDEAITVRDGDLSTIISGGIGDLTLTTQRKFSGGQGDITVSANGDVVGTIPYDDTEQTNTISGIDISGDVTLLLETPGNGDRVAMDDLIWTAADDFPSPYCDIDDSGVTVEEITAVGFAGTNIVNDNVDDVLIDKTDTIVDVMTSGTYTLEVEGNTSGDFETDIVAFIDWNQNEILDDEGEVYEVGTLENSTGADGTSVSLQITIPDDAVLGTTRIRITKTFTDEEGDGQMPPSPALINPCAIEFDAFEMGAEPGFGQALDFTLNIIESEECEAPTDLEVVNVTETTAEVTWTAGGDETMWTVIYGLSGFTQEDEDDYETELVFQTNYSITDLEPEIDYDVYVVAVCDAQNMIVSDQVGPFTFTTDDMSVDNHNFNNFTFYPNPVQNQLTLKAGEQIESVTVHNLLGQKVIDVNPNTLETQVDVDHLQAGVYLMNVTVNGTQKTFRIVKK